jgi:uncharacterized coiled-coil protein SlyX
MQGITLEDLKKIHWEALDRIQELEETVSEMKERIYGLETVVTSAEEAAQEMADKLRRSK